MRTLNLKNVIYFPSFNIIGGVETYCYEMDTDANIIRNPGDVWEATRFRGEVLESKNLAEIIEG